ncbi:MULTISPECIES: hypothetical protein [unclassified Pedobacter]|uniref:hypothetical protein n=1 Tax=unclassified Pedobacter TaxID=2628915 RepID=UPI001E45ADE3|nr:MULTISPECIES: hypothetical protein [unclassified Pedobacter]
MMEIILNDDIEQDKIDALLHFLKSRNIKAELRTTKANVKKQPSDFSLSEGIWSDYSISPNELRTKAWKKS